MSNKIPSLNQLINVYDFHQAARRKHGPSKKLQDAFMFYETGSLDEYTLRENQRAYGKIYLRPRVLVGVNKMNNMDTSIELFDGLIKSSFPFYITATTRSNLSHKDGEINILKAAYNQDIIYMLPASSSLPFKNIIKHKPKNQTLFYQLYTMNSKQDKEKKYLTDKLNIAIANGIKIICITVDSPCYSKRERYLRLPGNQWMINLQPALLNPSMNWLYIKWIIDNYKHKGIKILLKGIGCGEDVLKAYYFNGINGVIISNHGGRQLEYSRSSIEVLIESVKMLKLNNIDIFNDNFEIFIDGGIRRGTDIFKALCLGAKFVGIGRPIIYGLACYGQSGIEKILNIFKYELILCMQLMGVNSIKQIKQNMVTYKEKNFHTNFVPINSMSRSTYSSLRPKL